KVELKRPAGVDNDSRLRLAGEGEPGVNGGPSGDLYVFIHVKPHETFERRGNDVVCKVELSFVQAALGDEIVVPTLTGEETIQVPKGTQYGDTISLTNYGIPSLRTGLPGDQIVEVILKTPRNMSKRQEELMHEYLELESEKLTSRIKRIFTKTGGGSKKSAKSSKSARAAKS
ncbi:MAG: DnaJ C-terminal domain-containing protein, partial [Desulfosalsimonas sp.]